jgi:hypothetical protein
MLNISFAIQGIAPYSQSKMLSETRGKKESWDEFETRTWKDKAHTNGDGDSIVIAGHAIHQMLVVGAQKGRLQPKAAKSAREGLANRLVTGIALQGDAETSMKLSEARCVAINAHANGKRGSGTRVIRKYPEWPQGWTATFDVLVLDDSLTLDDLKSALEWGGLVCGLGRFRPENMGIYGRFTVTSYNPSELGIADLKAAA